MPWLRTSLTEGTLRKLGAKLGLADREAQWKPGELAAAERMESIFIKAGYATPTDEEVMEALKISPAAFTNIMVALTDEEKLIRLGERVTYSLKYLNSARDFVIRCIQENGSITAGEMRDKLGVTRKYTIAVLEYFDNVQLTRRLGDKRVLR